MDRRGDGGDPLGAGQGGLNVGLGQRLAVGADVADGLVLADVQLQIAGGGVEVSARGGADHQDGVVGLGGIVGEVVVGQHLAQGLGGSLALFGLLGKGFGVDLGARQLVAGQGQGDGQRRPG